MKKLIQQYATGENDNYNVIVIDDKGITWVGLTKAASDELCRFWSSKPDNSECLSYVEVVNQIKECIHSVERKGDHLDTALMFWPLGWDYWGGGIPLPLRDYLNSKEFRDAL